MTTVKANKVTGLAPTEPLSLFVAARRSPQRSVGREPREMLEKVNA